jgi:2-polyprenyl-3-methyl-5-hydroxy-6-metoxy-1,4-benzoquinol methylase
LNFIKDFKGKPMNEESRFDLITDGRSVLTGNVAKVKVLRELSEKVLKKPGASVLDVGCVGPQPLGFWEPLLARPEANFKLSGIDVNGIEKAEEVVRQRGWSQSVQLRQGSGYDLSRLYAAESFDFVVATQVLEHVARLSLFLSEVATVLKPGGEAFFTLDSAHWQSRFALQDPLRLAKNLVKKGLGTLGNERHYDLPWFDREIVKGCAQVGLEVVDCRYFNLPALKWVHNQLLPEHQRNAFMRLWLELEEFINEDATVRNKVKHLFLVIYLHVRKAEVRLGDRSEARGAVISQNDSLGGGGAV